MTLFNDKSFGAVNRNPNIGRMVSRYVACSCAWIAFGLSIKLSIENEVALKSG